VNTALDRPEPIAKPIASRHRPDRGRLVVSCRDGPGIIAAVSRFLADRGANIVHSDQHTTDPDGGDFFLRMVFDLPRLADRLASLANEFSAIEAAFGMKVRWALEQETRRIAIFVSGEDHCLLELLWHVRSGDLRAYVALVISNHAEMAAVVRPFGIPFHYVPVLPGQKAAAETMQQSLLEDAAVELIVLARYMQVLSPAFIARWPNRVINIHHSFLPAFVGARPFFQAQSRGVKLIGATAHYVTLELDEGPIIEQAVERVTHRDTVDDLKRKGANLEKIALANAIHAHIEHRVIRYRNKTVVFEA
jgi:formyltetrahydrofolate deformylase